ncbi:MAG TPA: ChaB family protein [Thermoanaerobaculia bacterium]
MFYQSIDDLPFVCQINLPEPALHVYRDAFNEEWTRGASNFHEAQSHAWLEVRRRFEKDPLSGRWIPRAMEMKPRVSAAQTKPAARTARST